MTDRDKRSFHIVFNLLLVVLIATLETSLWPQVLSPIPNPQIWLAVVVFVFLYQSPMESLLIVYIPSILIYILTMQPLGYLLLAQTLVFLLVMAIKARVFVPGQFYFSVIYALSVLVFQILIYSFAWIFEARVLSITQAFGWIIQSIIAFVISPFIYSLVKKLNPTEEITSTNGDSFL